MTDETRASIPSRDGAHGVTSSPAGEANLLPSLSLEDRLLVALAGRGAQRIGEFIELAIAALADKGPFTYVGSDWPAVPPLFWLSDEALVEAVERQVRGDDEGLLRAEREGVSGSSARATSRTEDVE